MKRLFALLLGLNILSTRCGGMIQIVATVGKLVPVVAILGMGAVSGQMPGASGLASGLVGSAGTAILGTLWAYDGWIGVTNMAGEMKQPRKNLPMKSWVWKVCGKSWLSAKRNWKSSGPNPMK